MAYYYCTKCGYQHQRGSIVGKDHWKFRSRTKTVREGKVTTKEAEEMPEEIEEESELEPLFSVSVSVNKRLLNHDLLELILAYALPMDEDEEE